ncbi:MAG: M24 family metallopeptidase [Chloroflexi bacterium]|nr:M24 family metallopeptidase [Chloroflexota bacterium]
MSLGPTDGRGTTVEPNPMYSRQYPSEGFSLEERDRRWGLVRTHMDAAGIDILVVPDESNSRYLTQMAYDVGPTIIPLEGEVTALSNQGRVGSAALTWVRDVRRRNRRWGEGIIERLRELDANGKIVGVVGLDGIMRRPDGDLNYATFIAMREVFQHTRWVGTSGLMQEARYRKSIEEIAFMTRAAVATDAGLRAIAGSARQGVTDRELWGQLVLGMMRAGGDPPRFAHLGATPTDDIRGFPVQPVGRVIGRGEILFNEVGGRYGGYEAQGAQPIAVGPIPSDWGDAWKVHVEAWERTWDVLRPGFTLGEIIDAARLAGSGRIRVRQTLHGQGLGDDMPLITSSSTVRNRMPGRRLEEGVCFVLKPYAEWSDANGLKELNWGDTVVITKDGARRLGTRPHELIIID